MNTPDRATWPALRAGGIDCVYQYGQGGAALLFARPGSPDMADMAVTAWDLWCCLADGFDLAHLLLVADGWHVLVSGHGGLIFLNRKPINLGLLLPKLGQFERRKPETTRVSAPFTTGSDGVLLNLHCRIVRAEVPRRLVVMAGDQRLEIAAHQGRFDLLAGAASVAEMISILKDATTAGAKVLYTLGEPPGNVSGQCGVADVRDAIGATDTGDADRWDCRFGILPYSIPSAATLRELLAVAGASAVLGRGFAGPSDLRLTGLGDDRKPRLTASAVDQTLCLTSHGVS